MAEIKLPTEFTVRRSTWARGGLFIHKFSSSSLYIEADGTHCCVGFLALAMGFSNDALADQPYLHDVTEDCRDEDICSLSKDLVDQGVYCINDDPQIQEKEREEILTGKFKELGIVIHFED